MSFSLLIVAVGYRLLILRRVYPSIFWDTASYVDFARFLARFHRLPPFDIRTPGYPAFLWLVGGARVNLWRAMRAQQLLGAVSNVLVGYIAWILTQRRSAAGIAGIASLALPDLLFYENTIYTETLARFLVLAAFAGLAREMRMDGRGRFSLIVGCGAVGLAPLVRPILAILVLTTVAALVLWTRSGELRPKRWATLGAFIAIAPAAGLVLWNVRTAGYFGLSRSAGKTLADCVGFPAVYEHLPDSLQGVRKIYETEGHRRDESVVASWEVMPQLKAYETAHGRVYDTEAALLGSVARRCLFACPRGYLTVWLNTTRSFLTDFECSMGFYATPEAARARVSQLAGWRYAWIRALVRFWGRVFPIIVLLALAYPFLGRRRGARWGYASAVGTTFVNTLLESYPGQARYRLPIEEIFLILAVVSVYCLLDRLRSGNRIPAEIQ